MPYRVAARPPRAGRWILTGPVFASIDAAHLYMALLREPVKRLVRTHAAAPVVAPARPAARIVDPAAPVQASAGLHHGLNRRRLEHVRHLVATNRLREW